jgi:putative ABC transport system permease protein
VSALSVTLRIARRDARRAKGRSLLVIAMIGLPVLGVGAVDVLYRSFQLSPEQQASRDMGAADAVLEDTGQVAITQQCRIACGFDAASENARTGPAPSPTSVVPAGSRALAVRSFGGAKVAVGGSTANAEATDVDLTDPLARGLYVGLDGRPPVGADQVVLSRALAHRMGVGVGDRVGLSLGERTRDVSVSGLVDAPDNLQGLVVLTAPGSLGDTSSGKFLVDVPRSLTWDDVKVANASGFAMTTRHDVPGQPPVPYDAGGFPTTALTAVSLVVGMTLLEIILLAGPAFAVGAKRRTRDLALLSASGAESRDIRRTVLGGGLVLGALGGVIGVVGGIALAQVAEPFVTNRGGKLPGPFELRPLELLGVVAVGIVTALLAAVLPARQAARQDVVAALTGRRGTIRSLKRTPVLGLVAAGIGTAVAFWGASRRDVNIILAGSALAELGLVATTPFVVGQVGRLGAFLPLGPRLALRDGARNRGRTAPAVSAILAAVAGSVAVGTYLSSLDKYDERSYVPSAAYGSTVVRVPTAAAAAEANRVLTANLPGASVRTVQAVGVQGPTDTNPTYVEAVRPGAADGCCPEGRGWSTFYAPVIGDASTAKAVDGLPDDLVARATEVLARGGALAPANVVSADGRVELLVHREGGNESKVLRVRVPAMALPKGGGQDVVLSPAAAAQLPVRTGAIGVIAVAGTPPTAHQEDRMRSALAKADLDGNLQIERGYSSNYGAGLLALVIGSAVIVLGASGIATGLAAADGRADLSTLAAVGASPRTRRTLAAFQSAVTAGLGTLLGTVAGLVPAIGMVRALNSSVRSRGYSLPEDPYPLVLPWGNLLVTVLVVPLVAAAAAALLTRSRLPMVRRLA